MVYSLMQLQLNQRVKLCLQRAFLEPPSALAAEPWVVSAIRLPLWGGQAAPALTGHVCAAEHTHPLPKQPGRAASAGKPRVWYTNHRQAKNPPEFSLKPETPGNTSINSLTSPLDRRNAVASSTLPLPTAFVTKTGP